MLPRPVRLLVAALLPALLLIGCDRQSPQPFSVEVRVETEQGAPVEDAEVAVRPCYETEGETVCGGDALFSGLRGGRGTPQSKPVEMSSWTVERDGNAALLRWTTASETNNDRFVVERKIGSGSFTEIGDVEGAGTTDSPTEYSFRDTDPSSTDPQHTYRLMAVATDGTVSLAGDPQSILLPVESRITPIFPNPFRDRTLLRVTAETTSTLRSTLHTLDGTPVQTFSDAPVARGRHELLLSAEGHPDGLYELRTRLGTNGTVAARDTTYAAIIRAPENAASLGTTGASGQVSTTERVRFPGLFAVPPIEVRDASGSRRGTLRVASTVQFVVTTPSERATFRRSISDERNALTLILDD